MLIIMRQYPINHWIHYGWYIYIYIKFYRVNVTCTPHKIYVVCCFVVLLYNQTMLVSWWRQQNGNIFRITGLCAGNSPVTGEFPSQGPVTRSFDVFFHLRLIKRLSKQTWGWWFEKPSHPLSRYSNVFDAFNHILQGCFTFAEAIVRLSQCQTK